MERNIFNTKSLVCSLEFKSLTDKGFTVGGRKYTHTYKEKDREKLKVFKSTYFEKHLPIATSVRFNFYF